MLPGTWMSPSTCSFSLVTSSTTSPVNERPIEELELGLVELFETLDLEAFAELFALADLLGTSAGRLWRGPAG
jgi:hypothetical protein